MIRTKYHRIYAHTLNTEIVVVVVRLVILLRWFPPVLILILILILLRIPYRVWIISNAKRQCKTFRSFHRFQYNFQIQKESRSVSERKKAPNAISPFGSLLRSHRIDILALYFLFFRIVVNAGDSIFDYDPFTALDPLNVARRIKNDDKRKNSERERERG